MRKTYYFNTGVRRGMNTPYGIQVWKDGTIQIPFECENVPEGASFKFACDDTNNINPNFIFRKILNSGAKGGLCSKCAYFQIIN